MAVTDDPPAPKLDPPLLHCIDMSSFSQSELRTLCAISNARLKLSNSDNVVIPQINPAVFNESAAGRKQTYSPRKRPSSVGRCRRPSSSHPPAADDDESLRESKLIIGFFKQYMQNRGGNVEVPETRKRRSENLDGGGGSGVQIVNKNGVAVDLRNLEVASDPYGGELMRRTAGMEREEELLGFLKGLEGEWCSRRKKRKIVDASVLGDALPVGWKIIIALKRQAGRFSPFCRRYISPTGKHLPSCKEVAAYLSSYFASSEVNFTDKVCAEGQGVVLVKDTGTSPLGFHSTQHISNPTKLPPSLPLVYEDAAASGAGNLCDVQVCDFFECYKCKVKFSEKDAYVKHLLSSYENTPKRYRMGSSIGKGVIFRDGKYECQFCHKVFENKKRYSGHVGVHVRNFNRGSEELCDAEAIKCTEEPFVDKMPSDLSKMDALLSVAQSSTEALPCSVSEKGLDADNLAVTRNSTLDSSKLEMENTYETAKNVMEVPSPVGGITQILVGNMEMDIDDHQSSVYVDESSNEEIHNPRTKNGSESHHEDGNGLAAAAKTPSPSSFKESPVALDKGGKSTCDINSGTNPASSTCTEREKRVNSIESFVPVFNKCGKSSSATGSTHTSVCMAPQKLVNSVEDSMKVSEKGGERTLDGHAFASREPQKSLNSLEEFAKQDSVSFIDGGSGCASPPTPPQNFRSFQASPKGIKSSSGTREGHVSSFTALQKTSSSFKGTTKLQANPPGGNSGDSHINTISASIAPQMSISAVPETGKGGENLSQQGVIELDDLMLEDPESGNHNTVVDRGPIFLGADPTKLDCMARSEATPHPFRTVCVWCGTSFYPEVAVSEEESDSVGYMCTGCRTKISKQISELERSWAKTSAFL